MAEASESDSLLAAGIRSVAGTKGISSEAGSAFSNDTTFSSAFLPCLIIPINIPYLKSYLQSCGQDWCVSAHGHPSAIHTISAQVPSPH